MKESYKEDLANHFGHESYADGGNAMGGIRRQDIELRSSPIPSADTVVSAGRQHVPLRYWQAMKWLGGVEEPEYA